MNNFVYSILTSGLFQSQMRCAWLQFICVTLHLCVCVCVCVCVTTHNSAAKSELRVGDLGGQQIVYPLTIHYLDTGN